MYPFNFCDKESYGAVREGSKNHILFLVCNFNLGVRPFWTKTHTYELSEQKGRLEVKRSKNKVDYRSPVSSFVSFGKVSLKEELI